MPTTPDSFRSLALSLPLATEGSHNCHPDFRVGGKIFATLWDDNEHGMVKLTPSDQRRFVKAHPGAFEPVKGAWGKQGCTQVNLADASVAALRKAMAAAWRNTAPRSLVDEFDED